MAGAGKACAACGGHYGPEVLFCPLDGNPLSRRAPGMSSPGEDPYLNLELPGQISIQALVGIGSMGRVYRAFQAGVDRDVAVKILHRELVGNPELVARFHREAKIASKLLHPNVVQALMTGSLSNEPGRTAGEVYLVMEFLDGISLLSALAAQGEGGALPLARTLHIVLQICEAVGEAHAAGIIHRDLKPDNIMLVRRSEDPDFVKILDFGIAKLDSSFEGSATQAGRIFGTAKYISPEGAEGKLVGPQADVYSIATVLYQCLAGRTPFDGESPMTVLMQQINGEPVELRSIERAAYVPEAIAKLVMQNLAKDPEQRAENAKVLGRDLSQAAREAGLHLDSFGGLPKGDLRLISMQRTRQHEFTPELKATIAAASPSKSSRVTQVVDAPTTSRTHSSPPAPPPPSSPHVDDTIHLDAVPNSESKPALSRPGGTVLEEDSDTIHGSLESPTDTLGELRARGLLAKPGPTMPGAPVGVSASPTMVDAKIETMSAKPEPASSVHSQEGRRPPSKTFRVIAVGFALLLPVAVVAGVRVAKNRTASIELERQDRIDAAESALARRDWAAPPGANVKDLTNEMLVRDPEDPQALAIRRQAVEQIVSEALQKKFEGARDQALVLAKLAQELAPDLKSAEVLVAELEKPTSSAAPTSTAISAPPTGEPKPTSKSARPPNSPVPATSAKASATVPSESIDPPPAPDLVPPPPNSAGKWL